MNLGITHCLAIEAHVLASNSRPDSEVLRQASILAEASNRERVDQPSRRNSSGIVRYLLPIREAAAPSARASMRHLGGHFGAAVQDLSKQVRETGCSRLSDCLKLRCDASSGRLRAQQMLDGRLLAAARRPPQGKPSGGCVMSQALDCHAASIDRRTRLRRPYPVRSDTSSTKSTRYVSTNSVPERSHPARRGDGVGLGWATILARLCASAVAY